MDNQISHHNTKTENNGKRQRVEESSPEAQPDRKKSISDSSGAMTTSIDNMPKLMEEFLVKLRVEMNGRLQQIEEKMEKGFKSIEEKMDGKLKQIIDENVKLKKNQAELEKRIDQMERREKRNNLIITGLQLKPNETVINSVEGLFGEMVDRKLVIKEAFTIGNKKVLVKMDNFEDKLSLMKNKMKLKNRSGDQKIYLDDDMTTNERKIQFKARQWANDAKKEGKKVKVGYKKIQINDKWHLWDENKEQFVESAQMNF